MPETPCALCGFKDKRYKNDLKSPGFTRVEQTDNDDNGMNQI